jgi:hypothetical protein
MLEPSMHRAGAWLVVVATVSWLLGAPNSFATTDSGRAARPDSPGV